MDALAGLMRSPPLLALTLGRAPATAERYAASHRVVVHGGSTCRVMLLPRSRGRLVGVLVWAADLAVEVTAVSYGSRALLDGASCGAIVSRLELSLPVSPMEPVRLDVRAGIMTAEVFCAAVFDP